MSESRTQNDGSETPSTASRRRASTKPPIPVFRAKMADKKDTPKAADKLKRKDRVSADKEKPIVAEKPQKLVKPTAEPATNGTSTASPNSISASKKPEISNSPKTESKPLAPVENGKENGTIAHVESPPTEDMRSLSPAISPRSPRESIVPLRSPKRDDPVPAIQRSPRENRASVIPDWSSISVLSKPVDPEAAEKESADSYRAPIPTTKTKPISPLVTGGNPPSKKEPEIKDAGAVSAILRGMEILAETDKGAEENENSEEIRRLDTQLGHLNECLDKFEVKIRDGHNRIQGQLTEQKAARLNRRASFQQRLEKDKAEDGEWSNSVASMLNRCRQNRNSVASFDPQIQNVLDQARAVNQGDN